ncbi:putative secreted protein (Por secretion system target) [Winogradskyella wandonensis]|uniref:Putative secreted protein (Por secretion system target) n=1 Tax=Winogradskyella wandonensis TaxID=1442586 RepID=A0A4R1KRY8_9FLAO|nr:LamG-like jellyroll fold domain-containing protein [Winogradskyella wandonensis]TCK67343.1 putative secreted protein (Por secretion system target) [Winogradskyella wandonensis]
MKIRLLLFGLLISKFCFAQIPNDEVVRYKFTNASLLNEASTTGQGNLSLGDDLAVFITGVENDSGSALEVNNDFIFADSNVNAFSKTFTVSFWIRLSNTPSTTQDVIFQFFDLNDTAQVMFSKKVLASGQVEFAWQANLASNTNVVPSLTIGNWHNITMVASEVNPSLTAYRLFVDGVFDADLTGSATDIRASSNNYLVYRNIAISPTAGYQDDIDNIRIYNRELSNTEVASIFSENVLSSNDFSINNFRLNLYPNPTSNILNIESNNQQIKQIEIYDILGKQLLIANNSNIDVSNLKSGIYILKAKTTLGEVVKRFIKQ